MPVKWADVCVGDVVRVENGQPFPADLLLVVRAAPAPARAMCSLDRARLASQGCPPPRSPASSQRHCGCIAQSRPTFCVTAPGFARCCRTRPTLAASATSRPRTWTARPTSRRDGRAPWLSLLSHLLRQTVDRTVQRASRSQRKRAAPLRLAHRPPPLASPLRSRPPPTRPTAPSAPPPATPPPSPPPSAAPPSYATRRTATCTPSPGSSPWAAAPASPPRRSRRRTPCSAGAPSATPPGSTGAHPALRRPIEPQLNPHPSHGASPADRAPDALPPCCPLAARAAAAAASFSTRGPRARFS